VEAVAGDEHVARVFAQRDDLGEAEAGGGLGRQILEAVDGEVDAAVEEGGLEFAGEKADRGGGGQWRGGVAVAGGGDDFESDGEAGVGTGQGVSDGAGLGEGEAGAARAEEDFRAGSDGRSPGETRAV
jgi:hypothetical protein